MPEPSETRLTFRIERETKNTVRYQEQGDEPHAIGTLYLTKQIAGQMSGVDGVWPEEVKVTVEPV